MSLSILTYSLFTGAGFFAQQAWHLGLFRFIASLGMGGEWAVAVALVMECWPERHRPKLAGAIGAASNVGFLFIGIVAWVSPVMSGSWRWLMLVGAVPAILALFVSLLVPESERWKAARRTAKSNPVGEIFGPKLWKKTLLAIVFSSIALIGTWAAVSGWIPNWVEQMKQAELTETLLPESKLTSVPANELGKARPGRERSLVERTMGANRV